jgi:hypothetical protein
MIMARKLSLALATAAAALATITAMESASAGNAVQLYKDFSFSAPVVPDNIGPKTMPNYSLLRAPRPNLAAKSQPSNRDMRGTSYMGGRGMMRGGGRMNGGMGGR